MQNNDGYTSRKFIYVVIVICLVSQLAGCATATKKHSVKGSNCRVESRQDVESAVGAVVSTVSGQDVKPGDLQKLGRQIRTDEETRSAVGVLEKSLSGQGGSIKYCPVDGKRYSARLVTCPEHGVALKQLDE